MSVLIYIQECDNKYIFQRLTHIPDKRVGRDFNQGNDGSWI